MVYVAMKPDRLCVFFQKIQVLATLYTVCTLLPCTLWGNDASWVPAYGNFLTQFQGGGLLAKPENLLGAHHNLSIDLECKKDFFECHPFDDNKKFLMGLSEQDLLKKRPPFENICYDNSLRTSFNQASVRFGIHHNSMDYSIGLGNALYSPFSLKSLCDNGKYLYTDIKFRYNFNAAWAAEFGAMMCVSNKKPAYKKEQDISALKEGIEVIDEKQNFSDFSQQVNNLTKPMGSMLCETFFSVVYYFCSKQ